MTWFGVTTHGAEFWGSVGLADQAARLSFWRRRISRSILSSLEFDNDNAGELVKLAEGVVKQGPADELRGMSVAPATLRSIEPDTWCQMSARKRTLPTAEMGGKQT